MTSSTILQNSFSGISDISGRIRFPLQSSASDTDWQIKFLSWAGDQAWINSPSLRQLEINGVNFFRVAAEATIFNQDTEQSIVGAGRSANATLSIIKCYAEIIERVVALNLLPQIDQQNSQHVTLTAGTFTSVRSTGPKKRNLFNQNTNGWAVHSHPESAVLNALQEAIERHLLILTIAMFGWSGFCEREIGAILGKRVFLLTSLLRQGNFAVQMIRTKLNAHIGSTFGFYASDMNQISDPIVAPPQAVFESLEPAVYFDSLDANAIGEIASGRIDLLERIQASTPMWQERCRLI